jgi:hypothetical protein
VTIRGVQQVEWQATGSHASVKMDSLQCDIADNAYRIGFMDGYAKAVVDTAATAYAKGADRDG